MHEDQENSPPVQNEKLDSRVKTHKKNSYIKVDNMAAFQFLISKDKKQNSPNCRQDLVLNEDRIFS